MRFVLDTAVMVAAIRSEAGASRWLLRSVLERHRGLTMLISVPLLIEDEAVMTRNEHLEAAGLNSVEIGALLDAVAAVAEPVRLAYLWRPTLPDADDDMVLETAANGRADGIVTFNIEARKLADAEGVALNQLINVAVAEKISALRTEGYLAERAKRADLPKALRILERSGRGRSPTKGDELPAAKRRRSRT